MADATITAVAQELRETNEGIADVSTNTSEMVPYLDYSMNMNEGIHQKLTELISLMSSNFAQDDKENKNLFGSLRDSFSEKLNELIKFMRGDELQKLEDKREEKPPEVREFPNQEQSNDLIQELISKLTGVFEAVADTLKILLAPFAVIIGTIIGTFKGYIDSVKAIGLTVSNIVKVLTRGAVDLQKIFSNIRAVISAFANVPGNLIRSLTNISGPIQGISKFFAAVKTQLSTATKAVKSVLLPITQTISNSVRIISSAFKSVTDALGPIGKVLGNIGGLLRGTVQVVRSFVPFLNFFFVGFETIKGIFKGFKEGGILGALEGGITGFINGFIAIPLDLLKGALAFLAGALGMDGIANALRSFSFKDIFASIVAIPFNLIKSVNSILNNLIGVPKDIIMSLVMAPVNLLRSAKDFLLSQLGFDGSGMPSILDIVTGIITAPYDLVRSVAAWIAGKLGFEQVSNLLSSFSFSDIFDPIINMVKKVFSIISNIGGFIKDKIGGFLSTVGGFFGLGPDEEEEQKKLEQKVRERDAAENASAIGYKRRDGEITEIATERRDGVSEASNRIQASGDLMRKGYAVMDDKMREEYKRNLDQEIIRAADNVNIAKNTKTIGDMFGSLSDTITSKVSSAASILQNMELPSITDIIMAPFTLFSKARNYLIDKIMGTSVGQLLGNIGSAATDFLKGILRSVLPDPSKDYGLLDPAGWAAKAIPDSVYKFAGMNPETGELMESEGGAIGSGSAPASVSAGSQLERESTQQRDAQREQAAARTATNGGGGNTNISTNVQNNQQSIIRNRPPASSEPDNASDTMMLGWAP